MEKEHARRLARLLNYIDSGGPDWSTESLHEFTRLCLELQEVAGLSGMCSVWWGIMCEQNGPPPPSIVRQMEDSPTVPQVISMMNDDAAGKIVRRMAELEVEQSDQE